MNRFPIHLLQLDSLCIELDTIVDGYKSSPNQDSTRIEQWQARMTILKGACEELRSMHFIGYWWYLDQAISRLQSKDPSLSKVLISMRFRLDNDHESYIEVDPSFNSEKP